MMNPTDIETHLRLVLYQWLLLFQLGMEFDFGHLGKTSRTVLGVSLEGLIAPAGLGLDRTTVMTAPLLKRWLPPAPVRSPDGA